MSLEETEINVGGTKFKGAHIAVVLAFVSTISGGIWATSEFFSRVGVLEDTVAEMQAKKAGKTINEYKTKRGKRSSL